MTTSDVEYYNWLVSCVHIPNGKSYFGIFEIMHNTEYHWTVPNDNNRIADGLNLRPIFRAIVQNGEGPPLSLDARTATTLEVLVALSTRMEFQMDGQAPRWAWKLLKNLRLTGFDDPLSDEDREHVNDILHALIWRTYKPNGQGGFFPLKHPEEDQREVEVWYQMNKYAIERSAR